MRFSSSDPLTESQRPSSVCGGKGLARHLQGWGGRGALGQLPPLLKHSGCEVSFHREAGIFC